MRYADKLSLKSKCETHNNELVQCMHETAKEILDTVRQADDDARDYLAQMAFAQLHKAYDTAIPAGFKNIVDKTLQILVLENPNLLND